MSPFEMLNLTRYLPFFDSKPDEIGLAIFNRKSLREHCCTEEKGESCEKTWAALEGMHLDWDKLNDGHKQIQIEGNEFDVFALAMVVGANERRYWLVMLMRHSPDRQRLNNNKMILAHVCACLQEDYLQHEIVLGMSDELTVRYEELNLLYGMEDIESVYRNKTENEALLEILNNAREFLNLELCALFLPKLEIELKSQVASEHKNYDSLIFKIYHKAARILANKPETLVINRDFDSDWTDAGLHIPYKIILVPVFHAENEFAGLLLLLNDLDKKDFSNSDRKLAEILATESSKLIQSRRDAVTGQLNRRGFAEKMNQTLNQQNLEQTPHTLLLVNLDQFKVINDTAGQLGGDNLLKQINSLIHKNIKKDDVLARLGADEFAVLLSHCNVSAAEKIADRIRRVIKQYRYFYQEKLFDLSACIGIVELTPECNNFSTAIRHADLACGLAKEQGRNLIHIYSESDVGLASRVNQMHWVSRINIGLEDNKFCLYRQMIKPLQPPVSEKKKGHYEILIRLQDDDGSIISPFHFIPAAERYNMMPKLDRWVLLNLLKKIKMEAEKGIEESYSINLSGQSFCEENFIEFVVDKIHQFKVNPKLICFEITETAAVSNFTKAIEFIEKLKQLGCQFSLDDFGSGMSSFAYLKNLPVDYLKIDGHFVKTMLDDAIDKAMVQSIHQIGHVMGLETIAEYVENEAIEQELRAMGIDYGQGYGIGKPEPF